MSIIKDVRKDLSQQAASELMPGDVKGLEPSLMEPVPVTSGMHYGDVSKTEYSQLGKRFADSLDEADFSMDYEEQFSEKEMKMFFSGEKLRSQGDENSELFRLGEEAISKRDMDVLENDVEEVSIPNMLKAEYDKAKKIFDAKEKPAEEEPMEEIFPEPEEHRTEEEKPEEKEPEKEILPEAEEHRTEEEKPEEKEPEEEILPEPEEHLTEEGKPEEKEPEEEILPEAEEHRTEEEELVEKMLSKPEEHLPEEEASRKILSESETLPLEKKEKPEIEPSTEVFHDLADCLDENKNKNKENIKMEMKEQNTEIEEKQPSDYVTVITKQTRIDGSIYTDGSLEIQGVVGGNATCLGKLTIFGTVKGDAEGAEIYISETRLEGGVKSASTVKIGVGTVIVGNISGTSAVIAGAVRGDIDVDGPVIIDSTAVVQGNITAKSIQINNGAIIEGHCSLSHASININEFFDVEAADGK